MLVSFGWNDAAEAIGQPDKTFKIPPWPVVMCQRALVRYRAYLVLMYYTQKWRAEPPVAAPGRVSPRVSVEDYLANMDRFRTEAARRGIAIAYLDAAAQAAAGRAEQELDLAGIGAEVQRSATGLGPATERAGARCTALLRAAFDRISSATSATSRRRATSGWPSWCAEELVAAKARDCQQVESRRQATR